MALKNDFLYAGLDRVLLAASKTCATLLLARELGADGQGVFALFTAICSICSVMSLLGIEIANNFYASRADEGVIGALTGNSMLLSGGGALVAYTILASPLGYQVTSQLSGAMKLLLAAGTLVASLSTAMNGLLFGLAGYKQRLFATAVHNVGFLCSLSLLSIFDVIRVEEAAAAWTLTLALAAAYTMSVIAPNAGWRIRIDLEILRHQLGYGLRVYPYNAAHVWNFRFDALIIGRLLGMRALGVYSIAVTATEVLLYIPKAASNVVLTQVSKTGRASVSVYHSIAALLLVCGVMIAAAAPYAIRVALKEEFAASVPIIWMLLSASFAMGMGIVACHHLFGLNRTRTASAAAVAAAVAITVLDLALIPLFHLHGAAVASVVAYGLFMIIAYQQLSRHEGRPMSSYFALHHSLVGHARADHGH